MEKLQVTGFAMQPETERFGCQSMVAPIRRLLLKHPRDAFRSQKHVTATWKDHRFLACPDYDRALREYDAFAGILAERVPDIVYLPSHESTDLDAIYVHDPVIVGDSGAVLCQMGKTTRRGEPAAVAELLPDSGVPVLGAIKEPGRLEGGDVLWVGPRTLAIGHGYRTNAEGIRQLGALLKGSIDELIVVPLPHWTGPSACLHLMSFISLVDDDLAVVYSKLMPVFIRDWLLDRGITFVEVPDDEFGGLACNVLALAPRVCLMLDSNPVTRRRLEAAGAEVLVFSGQEICLKGEGGPTCLTRPLLRSRHRINS